MRGDTCRRAASVRTDVGVSLGALVVTACAAPKPKLSSRLPQAESSGAKAPTGAGGTYKVGKPYQVAGVWYVPKEDPTYNRVGTASWYGAQFHAKATANGEVFDMDALTAAHTTLPLPSLVEVTNLENGRKVILARGASDDKGQGARALCGPGAPGRGRRSRRAQGGNPGQSAARPDSLQPDGPRARAAACARQRARACA